MSKMSDLLIGEIEELSVSTGYSVDFLLDTWDENAAEMTFDQFRAAALRREWVEVNPMADVLWTITIAPDCKKPVVRVAETEKPYSYEVTIMYKDFTGLAGLVAEALQQLDALRRGIDRQQMDIMRTQREGVKA